MPKPSKEEIPTILAPYISLGLDLELNDTENATAQCPWCNNDNGKFSVNVETGLWRCWVCGEGAERGGGNIYTFMNLLLNNSISSTSTNDLDKLRAHRKLETVDTLVRWNVVKSTLNGQWMVPGYNHESKIVNLYRYSQMKALYSTKGLTHGLYGVDLLTRSKNIFVCEGPWDAMALWEVLRKNRDDSAVIAVPGCNVFEGIWYKLFSGKTVNILFDNDHPKKEILEKNPDAESGAFKGLKRVASMLMSSPKPPEQINYIMWGDKGYDLNLKSGLDVRDILCEGLISA